MMRFASVAIVVALVGCESGPPPEEIGENFIIAAYLEGDRNAALALLVDEDAELARTNSELADLYMRRNDAVQLAELRKLLLAMTVISAQPITNEGPETEIEFNITYPDHYEMLEGMWGTSFTDYLSADKDAKKVIDLRILEAYSSNSPPMTDWQVSLIFRREAGEWRVLQNLQQRLDEKAAIREESEAYFKNIVTDSLIIELEDLGDTAIHYAKPSFRNIGDKTVSAVEFNAYFLSSDGERIGELEMPVDEYNPVKPGYEFSILVTTRPSEPPQSWSGNVELELESLSIVKETAP